MAGIRRGGRVPGVDHDECQRVEEREQNRLPPERPVLVDKLREHGEEKDDEDGIRKLKQNAPGKNRGG